jgi:hypothetical protein
MDNIKDILNVKDNYCVYFHKKKDTGEIFYIGSGRQNKREFNFNGRSNSWNAIKETNGVIVEVYAKNLKKTEARRLEEELINSKNYPNIVNIRKTINTDNSMSSDMFENYVYVDNTSKTGLKWKTKMGARGKIGTDAGNLTFDKMQRPRSITVKINGITYKASRIIWTLCNKFLESDMVIDHICKVRNCCNPDHLRQVTKSENSLNRKANADPTLCVNGHPLFDENSQTHISTRRTRHNGEEPSITCKICNSVKRLVNTPVEL